MGASVSKASVTSCQEVVQKITNNSVQKVNSNCSQGIQSTQNITIGEIDGSNNNTFTNRVNVAAQLICVQASNSKADFENAITAGLTQDLTAGSSSGVALGLSVSTSDIASFSSAISNVANSFEMDTFQSCINTILVEQNFTVRNGIYNSDGNTILNDSTINAAANCNQANSQLVKAQNDLAAELSTKATSTSSSGFSLGSIGIIVFVFILLLFLSLIHI